MKIGMKLYVLVIVVALSGVVIGFAYNETKPEMVPQQVHIEVETDKASYGLDEYVNITVRLINDDIKEAIFDFETDYHYDLIVHDPEGNEVFNLFENFTIYNDPTNITLPPKSEDILLEKFTWNRADKNGEQVPPGNYTIYSKLVGYDISDEKQISIGDHREVYIKVVTDKNAYRIGENVSMNSYLVNERNQTLTLQFGNQCQLNNTRIFNSSYGLIFDSNFDPACQPALSYLIINSGEELQLFNFTWEQLNYTGRHLMYDHEYYRKCIEYHNYCGEGSGFVQVPPDLYRIYISLLESRNFIPAVMSLPPFDHVICGSKSILLL